MYGNHLLIHETYIDGSRHLKLHDNVDSIFKNCSAHVCLKPLRPSYTAWDTMDGIYQDSVRGSIQRHNRAREAMTTFMTMEYHGYTDQFSRTIKPITSLMAASVKLLVSN